MTTTFVTMFRYEKTFVRYINDKDVSIKIFIIRIFSFGGVIDFQELQRKEERRREERDEIFTVVLLFVAFC